jgi:shikimate kinase
VVYLIGPGGAGKTTTGRALADRLDVPFVDVDAEFVARRGDVSVYLGRHGYEAYAAQSASLHAALTSVADPFRIVALSSGFMTYPQDVHPSYRSLSEQIASSPSTFVLLPTLDLEACVAETVRRQLTRSFSRSPEREEHVIRARFPIYASLPARKVETMRSVEAVVAELLAVIVRAERHGHRPTVPHGRSCPSRRASSSVTDFPRPSIRAVGPGERGDVLE